MDDNPFRQYQGTFLRTIANMLGDGKPTKEVRDRVINWRAPCRKLPGAKSLGQLGSWRHLLGATESYINTLKNLLHT